jgi:hypothetical protein
MRHRARRLAQGSISIVCRPEPCGTFTSLVATIAFGSIIRSKYSGEPVHLPPRLRHLLGGPTVHRRIQMAKDEHNKAAEHHENAAKAHRSAAQQHGSGDHQKGKQHSAEAQQHAKTAQQHSDTAHSKSQQQK